MADNWKPGDVAMVSAPGLDERRATWATTCPKENHPLPPHWHIADRNTYLPRDAHGLRVRRLVVIDPEDRESVERLAVIINSQYHAKGCEPEEAAYLQFALREFASPTPPEPSDPKARVADHRENIWRLLADGDWVCTDGPDVGEYLVWWQLAERGPLKVEGIQ